MLQINKQYLSTRQTFLTSQNAQINTIKKNKKDNNHKDKKKPKKEKKDIDSPTKDNNHKDKKKPKKEKKNIVDIVDSPTIDPLTKNSEDIYLFISTHLCMHA